MSLAHAILGLLTHQPMTGYDLKHEAFDHTIAHFWQADQAQIYRTLDQMEAKGWVSSTIQVQQDRPNRRVYSITGEGRRELMDWLHQAQSLPIYREAFLVQLFFANPLPNALIQAQIQTQIEGHQARLARYQQIPLPTLEDAAIQREQVFWRLTLELGIALENTYLNWLATCQAAVNQLDASDT